MGLLAQGKTPFIMEQALHAPCQACTVKYRGVAQGARC